MIDCINFDSTEEPVMRTTVTIDDALYAQALEVIEPNIDKSDLFREALKVFIRVKSAKRLATLGGRKLQKCNPSQEGKSNRKPFP
jgi:Arc/MetJ family transcription regulator